MQTRTSLPHSQEPPLLVPKLSQTNTVYAFIPIFLREHLNVILLPKHQTNPFYRLTSIFFKNEFNIIFLFTPRSLPFKF
jgi:hypothetical protein